MSVEKGLMLWSPFDIRPYFQHHLEGRRKVPSLYDSLFANNQISNPLDPDLQDPAHLPYEAYPIPEASVSVNEKASLIQAALNLSEEEFDLLVAELVNTPYKNRDLTLYNLSVFYRFRLLADTLRLSVRELLILTETALGADFSGFSDLGEWLRLIEAIQLLQTSGIQSSSLPALFIQEAEVVQLPDSRIATILATLREGVKQIDGQFPMADQEVTEAANKAIQQEALVLESIGNAINTVPEIIITLLPDLSPFRDDVFVSSDQPLYEINGQQKTVWAFPNLVDTINLLHTSWDRLNQLIRALQLSEEAFIYFYQNSSVFQTSKFWDPPKGANLAAVFPDLERQLHLIHFRNAIRPYPKNWYQLFNPIIGSTASKADFMNSFAALSGRPLADLLFLLGQATDPADTGQLGFNFPDDYKKGDYLLKLWRTLHVASQLGTSTATLRQLTKMNILPADADTAKALLKSKYDNSSWLDILQPISDQLRERRRDALVAHILNDPGQEMSSFRATHNIQTASQLYEHLLIDVKMSACMKTSRIKQAISSVQLFIDRCFLNLESIPPLSQDFSEQWNKWRKVYRIWEANRKIFLYPENWVEPELRDDKTPLFRALEKKLGQNEVTDEIAEEALQDYLERLDTIANLQVIGFFEDEETDILHVIGRTRNIPHHYYYRRQEQAAWTAWEKVDLDIEGDHILPVVWNGRLFLFWGVFEEKQERKSVSLSLPNELEGGQITGNEPRKYWEMKLAWSEFNRNIWSSKQISEKALNVNLNSIGTSTYRIEQILLNVKPNNQLLQVELLVPLRSDNVPDYDVLVNSLGGFYFNACNSSPEVYDNSKLPYQDYVKITKLQDTNIQSPFLSPHNSTHLALYENGIYQVPKFAIAYPKSTLLLEDAPGRFSVIGDHKKMNIKGKLRSIFFYSNSIHNFIAQSKKQYTFDSTDLEPSHSIVDLLVRKPIDSFPPNPESVGDLNVATNTFDSTNVLPRDPVEDSYTKVAKGISIHIKKGYQFRLFYHPYACNFRKIVTTEGIEKLYKGNIQNVVDQSNYFENNYSPTEFVFRSFPVEEVDFNFSSTYGTYNWELFFHIPLYIATRLNQ
ncbi:MAG: hypothetical protein KDC80_09420, partial [Saprospiraceae bacterium]|nr:hypothetical protein [Saprospiraceae bacterium]